MGYRFPFRFEVDDTAIWYDQHLDAWNIEDRAHNFKRVTVGNTEMVAIAHFIINNLPQAEERK